MILTDKNKQLADMLFPETLNTAEYYENLYVERALPQGAKVTRFAPSPTGFIHVGGLYAALVSERIAHQSKGFFYLRIEDTDKKREVEGGVEEIVTALANFGVCFDEGMKSSDTSNGDYGPYKQSERAEIYKTYIKLLVEKGLAYPCFCTEEDMEKTRAIQEEQKLRTGYYGKWATHRDFTFEQYKKEIESGKRYVVRLKSPGDPDKKIVHKDMIRGEVEFPENDQDIVILKPDGLPTYHFAHAVDDHLMRTTDVIRGDEWLSSISIHLQLFSVLGWQAPRYAHISPILKAEGTSKRKLSKRKDPEAAVSFYHEQGFPEIAVTEYLLNLVSSNFEIWRRENPTLPYTEFEIDVEKMSISGALFDIIKLTDMSRDLIATMDAETVYNLSVAWAQEYDTELARIMTADPQYTKGILGIERGTEKPRKDLGKWLDVRPNIQYLFDEVFYKEIEESGYCFPENFTSEDIKKVLEAYIAIYDEKDDKDQWFEKIKSLCEPLGYAPNAKIFKKNPELYKGHVGDLAGIIRVGLANRKNTSDMYDIMQVFGKERVLKRLGSYK